MRRFLLVLSMFGFFTFFALAQPTQAQLATCDQCGYCVRPTAAPGAIAPPAIPAPGNWESCAKCLYPTADSSNPSLNDTLRIDTSNPDAFTDVIPTTKPGRFFLSLAGVCLKTEGFTQPNAPGAFAQAILNVLFSIAAGISFLYILFGAYQVASAQNNPEKINYGKRLIVGAIVGLVVALGSIFLVNLIAGQILKIPGFGG